jgi:DNA-binding CsgD family transcriptional regulator
MGQSSQLRLRDVALAHRIVNECRDLWADPAAWRRHLVAGASQLTGMAVSHYSEFTTAGRHGKPRIFCNADVGWRDTSAYMIYVAASAAHPNQFKFFPGSERILPRLAQKPVVASRADLCPDDPWYKSTIFNEFRRPAHLDDNVLSAIQRGPTEFAILDLSQDVADARPTQRTKRQLALLHRLIEPLIGSELATEHQRGIHGLSPQLRATLELLLGGDSEKMIAENLGVRRATAHEYIGKVYRHFNVQSRPELMAYFVHRRPTPR